MSLRTGNVITGSCSNIPTPPDPRCNDPEFALLNPSICPASPALIIKPGVGLVCLLGSIQLKAFQFANGIETDVTSDTQFVSSDPTKLVIGINSGNATGVALEAGAVIVTATYGELSATASINVLSSGDCCGQESVAIMVVVDTSKSMSQSFGAGYPTRLSFAKAAATQFIGEVNAAKDIVGLEEFNALENNVLSVPVSNKVAVQALVSGIVQTSQSTSFFDALTTAVDALNTATADRKLLVLISDGEDQQQSYATDNPIAVCDDFKNGGGIVMCIGCRASGSGFARLEAFSTGGFFLNAYSSNVTAALDYMSGLKGYVCAGNCHPLGDEYEPTPELDYRNFVNWDVLEGTVNLIGPGLFDVLPGNGLYVGFDSSPSALISKETFSLASGKTYRVRLSIAGNQKIDNGTATVTVSVGEAFSHAVTVPSHSLPFTDFSFNFTVPADTTGQVQIRATIGDPSIAEWGVLVDDVSLDNVTDGITMFSDDFDDENSTYIPPRCGYGTVLVPGGGSTNVLADYTSPVWNDVDNLQPPTNNGTGGFPGPATGTILLYTVGPSDTNITIQVTTLSPKCLEAASGNVMAVLHYYPSNDPLTEYHSPAFDLMYLTTCSEMFEFISGISYAANTPIYFTVNSMPNVASPPNPPQDGSSPYQFRIVLLSDDFVPSYGYVYGYYCDGTGCLNEPPVAQLPDPNALADIEKGFTPPTVYHSTKQACVSCGDGFANFGFPAGVTTTHPTSDTYQFDFAAPTTIGRYSVTYFAGPGSITAWTLRGSSDGVTWTTLDVQTGQIWSAGQVKSFDILTPSEFTTLQFVIDTSTDSWTYAFSFYTSAPEQVCIQESASSEVSQADADNKALNAATIAAQSQLNCKQQFSSTESFTATCPSYSYGIPVTSTKTAYSFNSQGEADATALAAAQAEAEAALDCTLSNNTNQIVITDRTGADPQAATPYPSVQYVEDMTGVITNVTVDIKKLTHTFPDDILMVLRHPDGTAIYLMANCGGGNAISNVDLTFDDAAGSNLPDGTIITSGTYKPSIYSSIANLPAPAPQPPSIGVLLSDFNGKDPNGSWSLWIADDTTGGSGTIVQGWEIHITSS